MKKIYAEQSASVCPECPLRRGALKRATRLPSTPELKERMEQRLVLIRSTPRLTTEKLDALIARLPAE